MSVVFIDRKTNCGISNLNHETIRGIPGWIKSRLCHFNRSSQRTERSERIRKNMRTLTSKCGRLIIKCHCHTQCHLNLLFQFSILLNPTLKKVATTNWEDQSFCSAQRSQSIIKTFPHQTQAPWSTPISFCSASSPHTFLYTSLRCKLRTATCAICVTVFKMTIRFHHQALRTSSSALQSPKTNNSVCLGIGESLV